MSGREIDLSPGSPLVLTHKIKLLPSGPGFGLGPGSGAGSGSCGCEVELAALLQRVERLEKEASVLREKCDGGCCHLVEGKGTADWQGTPGNSTATSHEVAAALQRGRNGRT